MTEDDIVLAGGLALGFLDGEERAGALRRVLAEPAFADEVERWRRQLAGLDAEWPEAEPGEAVARRILAEPRRDMVASGWRWAAGASGLAAAALLVLVLARPISAPAPPPVSVRSASSLVAVLAPKDAAAVGVVIDPVRHTARIGATVPVPADRVAELWLIGRDGVPHAAALVPAGISEELALRPGIVPAPGTILAMSVEPIGGSPAPTPTGPIIANGVVVAIQPGAPRA